MELKTDTSAVLVSDTTSLQVWLLYVSEDSADLTVKYLSMDGVLCSFCSNKAF